MVINVRHLNQFNSNNHSARTSWGDAGYIHCGEDGMKQTIIFFSASSHLQNEHCDDFPTELLRAERNGEIENETGGSRKRKTAIFKQKSADVLLLSWEIKTCGMDRVMWAI